MASTTPGHPPPHPSNRKNETAGTEMASTIPGHLPPPHPRHPRTVRATFGILSPSESTMTQNKGKQRETGCWVCVLGGRVKVRVIQSCPTLCDPLDYTVHRILQARILKWVAFPFSRDLPNPGTKPKSPTLQVDSLPAEPQGKPKNTGVGSLSLLQQIFLAQASNPGLLHCRQILYQLSYQGPCCKRRGQH